jgi:hypothetical protein
MLRADRPVGHQPIAEPSLEVLDRPFCHGGLALPRRRQSHRRTFSLSPPPINDGLLVTPCGNRPTAGGQPAVHRRRQRD